MIGPTPFFHLKLSRPTIVRFIRNVVTNKNPIKNRRRRPIASTDQREESKFWIPLKHKLYSYLYTYHTLKPTRFDRASPEILGNKRKIIFMPADDQQPKTYAIVINNFRNQEENKYNIEPKQ